MCLAHIAFPSLFIKFYMMLRNGCKKKSTIVKANFEIQYKFYMNYFLLVHYLSDKNLGIDYCDDFSASNDITKVSV